MFAVFNIASVSGFLSEALDDGGRVGVLPPVAFVHADLVSSKALSVVHAVLSLP